jgi:hypothetical protein
MPSDPPVHLAHEAMLERKDKKEIRANRARKVRLGLKEPRV